MLICPCCAAHLCPPAGLTVARCENCQGVFSIVHEGGVTGLLPIPASRLYSEPRQFEQMSRSLVPLEPRRFAGEAWQAETERHREALARTDFWLSLATLVEIVVLGTLLISFLALPHVNRAHIQDVTALFLGAQCAAVVSTTVLASLFARRRLQVAMHESALSRLHQ